MEDEMSLEEIIELCSVVHLEDGTLQFTGYGSNELRYDTQAFLYKYGLTLLDAEKVINNLTNKDYHKGPLDHHNKNVNKHKLWIFKKEAFGMPLYIKLFAFNKNKCIAVISFHEDR